MYHVLPMAGLGIAPLLNALDPPQPYKADAANTVCR